MKISVNKNFLWNKIIQFCARCGTETVHALSTSGDFYGCACGESIEIELLEDEDETK